MTRRLAVGLGALPWLTWLSAFACARLIELASPQGNVVGQLHTAEDGSANLRLRSGQGEVRVKLGATNDGAGLVLLDSHTEPALQLRAAPAGPAITLEERGKPRRVLAP